MQINVGEIYRHVSGSFYTVIAVSSIEDDGEMRDIVVLKHLSARGRTVTCYLENFLGEVDKDIANLMGQKYLYVRVKDASCALSETTTEALVEELKTRLDNPYAKEGDTNVYEVVYEVGVYKPYRGSDPKFRGKTYFEVIVTKESIEDAVKFIRNHWSNSLRPVIMRVTKAVETSVRDLIDNR